MGADGVGKTTISKCISQTLKVQNSPKKIRWIEGGKQYTWDLAEKVKSPLTHFRDQVERGEFEDAEKRFFDFQAISCYRHISDLTEAGHFVVLDSDPIFKRWMWDVLAGANPQQSIERSLGRIHRLAGGFFPKDIVYVHPREDLRKAAAEIWKSVNLRDSSSYDPKSKDEVRRRLEAAATVYDHLQRLLPTQDVNLIEIANEFVSEELLTTQIQEVAQRIIARLNINRQ